MFIRVDHNWITLTLGNIHRDDLMFKKALSLRGCGALLTRQGKLVLICAINIKLLCHVLRGLRHGVYTIHRFELRINKTPAHSGVFNLLTTAIGSF